MYCSTRCESPIRKPKGTATAIDNESASSMRKVLTEACSAISPSRSRPHNASNTLRGEGSCSGLPFHQWSSHHSRKNTAKDRSETHSVR